MANRRPDLVMIAALELHGIVPHSVAETLIECYNQPPPVNYETALDFVRSRIFELIASGGLENVSAMPEPDALPVVQGNTPPAVPEGEHVCDDCCDDRPPWWWVNAFRCWDEMG